MTFRSRSEMHHLTLAFLAFKLWEAFKDIPTEIILEPILMPHILTFSKLCQVERKEKGTSGIASNENIFLVSLGMAVCNFFYDLCGLTHITPAQPCFRHSTLIREMHLWLWDEVYSQRGYEYRNVLLKRSKKVQEAFFVTKRYTKEENKWYDPRTELNVV